MRVLALLCLLFAAELQAASCPKIDALAEQRCVASAHGYFFAATEDAAQAMAADAAQAFASFERYFGAHRSKGAIVALGTQAALSVHSVEALKKSGVAWVLPWLSSQDKRRIQEATIRKQLTEKLGSDTDAARMEAMLQAAIKQLPAEEDESVLRSALRHEIGHVLLMEAFWPNRKIRNAAGHYGGPAPDWLDETAAILMEGEQLTSERRTQFFAELDAKRANMSLADFFQAAHPYQQIVAKTPRAAGLAAQQSGARISVLSGDAAHEVAQQANWFYLQSRAVADFLLEQSKDPKVFADIASAAAQSQSFAHWLAARGERFALPPDMASLQALWENWIQAQKTKRTAQG
jgi:hypothetical protein